MTTDTPRTEDDAFITALLLKPLDAWTGVDAVGITAIAMRATKAERELAAYKHIGTVREVTHAYGVEIEWTERPKKGVKLYA